METSVLKPGRLSVLMRAYYGYARMVNRSRRCTYMVHQFEQQYYTRSTMARKKIRYEEN